jgi:hypothetical protein
VRGKRPLADVFEERSPSWNEDVAEANETNGFFSWPRAFGAACPRARKFLVGGDGIAVEESLERPVDHWVRHEDDERDEERPLCGLCGKILRPNDSISVAEVGERCYRCFNEELAERLGVDFDNTPIAPIVVTDVDGARHRFEIRSMLVGTGHAMYAREVRHRGARGGYRFEVLGDLDADAQDLFKLLLSRTEIVSEICLHISDSRPRRILASALPNRRCY